MAAFVTREEMESEVPGAFELLPPQFRDRLPAGVELSPQNTDVIRKGFGFVQGFADQLFDRFKYKEGDHWPMWKLVTAYYAIEHELGAKTVRQVGTQIFSTMPWPTTVTNVVEAFRFMDQAYRASHGNASAELVGGWPLEKVEPGRLIVVNNTPYSFWLEDGTINGVCRGFVRQFARAKLIDDGKTKRDGGRVSRYEVTFNA